MANSKKTTSKPSDTPLSGDVIVNTPGTPPAVARQADLIAEPFGADASDEMELIAPTFGEVLGSIGLGVAESQTALDNGVVASAKELADKKINIVTNVIQELDDDGMPQAENTQLIQQEVSVLNYVKPTVHEWSHVALQMDLSVGEMDRDRGVSFQKTQASSSAKSYGLFWGFLGFGVHSDRKNSSFMQSTSEQEADWAQGQVRMDAALRPRDVQELGAPVQVNVGPQIYLTPNNSQSVESNGQVTERSVDIDIQVLKANGEANSGVNVEIDPGPYALELPASGTTTDTSGNVKATLRRSIPNALYSRPLKRAVNVNLGQIERTVEVTL
ncbi:hypothetical protein P886_1071 [Alteromonadaceae bacterium 2753L.S.0a.02]|nr:hypothetical protein P886_1071 [Alteromonadaceae bacterium 2753L.S.0a.02]